MSRFTVKGEERVVALRDYTTIRINECDAHPDRRKKLKIL